MNISKHAAALALLPNLDLSADFFELSFSEVVDLANVAKVVGYRRPRDSYASLVRCFFDYLVRGEK